MRQWLSRIGLSCMLVMSAAVANAATFEEVVDEVAQLSRGEIESYSSKLDKCLAIDQYSLNITQQIMFNAITRQLQIIDEVRNVHLTATMLKSKHTVLAKLAFAALLEHYHSDRDDLVQTSHATAGYWFGKEASKVYMADDMTGILTMLMSDLRSCDDRLNGLDDLITGKRSP